MTTEPRTTPHMTMDTGAAIAEIRKVVTVPQPLDEAFRLFTDDIGAWWPLATHSVGLRAATGVRFEPGEGGRIIESMASDATSIWGTLTVWEPPHRIRFTWHPGASESEATEVEVTFTDTLAGTAVELRHTGWDRRRDGTTARANYDTGWDFVLGFYTTECGRRLGRDATPGGGALDPRRRDSGRRI